ncbi:hypothetical protein D9613_000253 [Agrocybe pediades]|uniref:Uncharacterized protein n=1 Tax=Agrocybe pediades TaxID=84607 RepID=A0A8H4QZQ1_9AGAR|nr:hypothetical protein D9613_000253 [Agrocybe pediades]
MSQNSSRKGFSFFAMVGGVMALLKIKGKYDEYRQAANDDEEGRVALTSAPLDTTLHGHSNIALLDTEIPNSSVRTKKKKACCMCCGYDCSLLWKAIAIVLGLYTLYYGFKAIRWAMTDAPTGLENMPEFSTSLGCMEAPHIYNGSQVINMIPLRETAQDHAFDVHGPSVGTVTIYDGPADATEVKYETTIRTDNKDMLQNIQFLTQDYNDDGTIHRSRLFIETGIDADHCMRFDVNVYIPPNLKKFHISSHAATTHIQFAPGARIANTEKVYVTLYSVSDKNIIRPSSDVVAKSQTYEIYHGYIVGEASVARELEVSTQRGGGISNVKITPTLPADPEHPEKATIMTTTGAGRSDFEIVSRKAFHRQIEGIHTSTKNGDLYLTYRQAVIDGKIKLEAKSYTVTGASKFASPISDTQGQWTHYVGDKDGADTISVNSRGWIGLYF